MREHTMKSSSLRTALLSGVALAAAMGAGSAFAQQAQSTAGVAAQDGVALENLSDRRRGAQAGDDDRCR